MTTTKSIGSAAELRAAEFLIDKGFALLEMNFSCRAGEIDIIARDVKTLVFVEVRYRTDSSRGTGAETVTRSKQRKLIRTAQFYLLAHTPPPELDMRFDVISVDDAIDWIENAFTLNDI